MDNVMVLVQKHKRNNKDIQLPIGTMKFKMGFHRLLLF